jgi:NADH:ubiquinone oxidoreductase subunit 2 (subunit N)
VSAGFYFRIVRAMFLVDAPSTAPGERQSASAALALAACPLAVVAIGIGASPLLSAIGFSLR